MVSWGLPIRVLSALFGTVVSPHCSHVVPWIGEWDGRWDWGPRRLVPTGTSKCLLGASLRTVLWQSRKQGLCLLTTLVLSSECRGTLCGATPPAGHRAAEASGGQPKAGRLCLVVRVDPGCHKLSVLLSLRNQGYLFISVLVNSNSELIRLINNAIKNDLASRNPTFMGLALHCIANVGSREMAEAFAGEIPKILVAGYVPRDLSEVRASLALSEPNMQLLRGFLG